MEAVLVGDAWRPITLSDLQAVKDPDSIAALVIEQPMRHIGGQPTELADLVKIAAWCEEHGIAFHCDAARIWEVQPYFGVPHAEILKSFQSAYCSFCKTVRAYLACSTAGTHCWLRHHHQTRVLVPLLARHWLARQALWKRRVCGCGAWVATCTQCCPWR